MVPSESALAVPGLDANTIPLDVYRIREDFPLLKREVHGKPLVYLDNAATTQKPQAVLDALMEAYSGYYSNIHRGVHWLSQQATTAHEQARRKVKEFLNARHEREIVFTRNATESINLVASSYGRAFLREGDEILISALEHHANIVPWQLIGEEKGLKLRVIPMNDAGELLLDEYPRMLTEKTKFVALSHLSNALGTINPVKEMIRQAHERGIPVLVDGAQSAPHLKVDVRDLDCDFFVFSGHKLFGPTGIGVLFGKEKWLDRMPPYQGGGDMIHYVSFEKTYFNEIPYKFEAGTPHIAGAIGLGAAIDYVRAIGMDAIAAHEHELLEYATQVVSQYPEVRIVGTAKNKAGVLSFLIGEIHPHDIGTILDQEGVAIRTGHHCAQPVMDRLGIPATARASFAFYNTKEEIDILGKSIQKVLEVFR